MTVGLHCETERKYLIHYPDVDRIRTLPDCVEWQIEQIYLTEDDTGTTRRVRQIIEDGQKRYYRTFKRRISVLSSIEDEAEIDGNTYRALLKERDTKRQPIIKTRLRAPYRGHVLEFDIYPFWHDRAILEIELEHEDDAPEIPDFVNIIRDVSGEKAYKNRQLAKSVPMEEI